MAQAAGLSFSTLTCYFTQAELLKYIHVESSIVVVSWYFLYVHAKTHDEGEHVAVL